MFFLSELNDSQIIGKSSVIWESTLELGELIPTLPELRAIGEDLVSTLRPQLTVYITVMPVLYMIERL